MLCTAYRGGKMGKHQELMKNTAYITIGKVCTQFISFLLLPLYTLLLTTSEYGTADIINSYTYLLVYVVSLQIEQGVFRFLVEKRDVTDARDRTEIVSTGALIITLSSAVYFVIFMGVRKLVSIPYAIFLFINVVAVSFSGLTLQIARGFGDNIAYAAGSFISATVTIIFNVLFIAVFKCGAAGLLASLFLGNAACIVFLNFKCKIGRSFSFSAFNRQLARKLLAYSLPLIPNCLAWWIVGASDKSVVTFYMGAAANGILAIAHKFPNVYITAYQIFNTSWTESAALHIADDDSEEFFAEITNKAFSFFSCLCAGMIAVIPLTFNLLINEQYAAAYEQIPLHMIAAFFNALQGMYSVQYIALKRTKQLAISTGMAAIINLAVCLALIRPIGLYAASVSSIAAYAVIIAYRIYDLRKQLKICMEAKLIFSALALFAVTIFAYYSGNIIIQLSVLAIVIAASYMLNRSFAGMLVEILKKKLSH